MGEKSLWKAGEEKCEEQKDDHEVFLNPDFKKMVLTQFSDQLALSVQESKRALTLGNKRSDALKDALCSLFCVTYFYCLGKLCS